jgi:hypothetical protein
MLSRLPGGIGVEGRMAFFDCVLFGSKPEVASMRLESPPVPPERVAILMACL